MPQDRASAYESLDLDVSAAILDELKRGIRGRTRRRRAGDSPMAKAAWILWERLMI
ncbi:MAG: hypothetical protein ACJ78T_12745 [Myxococcales bacterium]